MESPSELRLRLDRQERMIATLCKRMDKFQELEMLLRDMEVDVAAIIIELRVGGFPKLLKGRRATVAHVGHGAVLTPETKREQRRRQAAVARAGKRVGSRKGNLKSEEQKQRLRAQVHGG